MDNITVRETDALNEISYPVACTGISVVPDGSAVLAVGVYKPSVKLFSLKNMSMKFERCCAEEPLKILSLTENTEKFAVLRKDRSIEFHTRNGLHEVIQVPYPVTDCVFNRPDAELYLSGTFDSIHSLDLEEGRFKTSIPIGEGSVSSSLAFSSVNGLLCSVGDSRITFIDPRSGRVIKNNRFIDDSLTCVSFSTTGITFSVGSDTGKLVEYDIRSKDPLHSESLNSSIKSLSYSNKFKICSAGSDIHIYSSEWKHTEINVGFTVNTFTTDGCVIIVGGESEFIKSYIVDNLGDMPLWCSSISN